MSIVLSKKLINQYPEYKLPKTSNLISSILKVSVPAAIEIFFVGLMGMIDSMMVGRYNVDDLAAVSITQQPVFITLAFCIGLNAGIIAIISRRKGENNPEPANTVLRNSLILGILASLFFGILALVFARPFMRLAQATPATIDNATLYFKIVTSCITFNYIRLIICSAQRAIGKTRITLITNVAANLINVFFNFCLIGGKLGFPEMGIKGAAIATVIGNVIACIIAIASIYKNKGFLSIKITDNWRLDMATIKLILRISSPAFLEQFFMRIGFFVSAIIVNSLGIDAQQINTIVNNVMNMSFNITDGFAIGASSLVGKSLGEKDECKAFAFGRLSQLLSLGVAMFTMTAAVLLRKFLCSAFIIDPDYLYIADEAGKYVLYTCIIMLPQSIQWVTTGVLRGAGDTKYTAVNSVLSVSVIRPILSFLLCYTLGFGLLGSWAGMFIDQIIRFIFNDLRFRRLKWIKIKA